MWGSTGIRVIPMCLEMSSGGHGDIREPFIELVRENGVRSSDFKYASYTITDSRTPLRTLPCAYSENGKIEHLCLTLTDGDLVLELHYCVFPDCDVITRSAKLINKGQSSVAIERLLSTQIDIPFSGTMVTSFHGSWAHEMNKNTATLTAGKFVIEKMTQVFASAKIDYVKWDMNRIFSDVYSPYLNGASLHLRPV